MPYHGGIVVTSSGVGSFVSLIAAAALVIILILIGIPSLARILLRYRLDTLRDDCVDAILDGKLPRDSSVQSFIRSVERIGPRARLLTLSRAIAMYLAFVKLGTPVSDLTIAPSYHHLTSDERKLMSDFDSRRQAALWSYLIWGSPMGWAIAPVLLVINRRVSPSSPVAKPEDALPKLTREAALCAEQSPNSATVEWMCGKGIFVPR